MAILSIPAWFMGPPGPATVSGGSTLNAVGESHAIIGHVHIEGGGSKTLSAAGSGRILWRTATLTWASGSTNLRVGTQGVDLATGFHDGVWDVYADLVPGVDTVAANSAISTTMDTGTQTMANGDLIAIVIEMTARGGADSVLVGAQNYNTNNWGTEGLPYGISDTGTPTKSSTALLAFIVFDDGTVGWIVGSHFTARGQDGTIAFNSGSSPDEYCATFTPPIGIRIDAIGLITGLVASGDTFELILYQDPLGTPSVLATLTPDPDVLSSAVLGTISVVATLVSAVDLLAGVTYGIALRPTTANDINITYMTLNDSACAIVKKQAPLFGDSIKLAGRTDQTGAFVETQTYHYPLFNLNIVGINAPTGSSFSFVG